MHKFTDDKGRDWTIDLNVHALGRVRNSCGVDLCEPMVGTKDDGSPDPTKGLLSRLANDPVILAAVIYSLCEEQAATAKVTPEDFGRGLFGKGISGAIDALIRAVADFSSSLPGRSAWKAITEKILDVTKAMESRAEAAVQSFSVEEIVTLARPQSGAKSIGSPESSDSTPDLTHTGNSD